MNLRIHTLLGLLLACGLVAASATNRFVSLAGGHVAPFTSWADAATNIQDAIDAASAGDTVWVTNGVYTTGGKVKAGDLTNRVALDKALLVQSINGPAATIIQGDWDPVTTNGPLAVRCAWLTNGATLNGFTLRGGATRNTGLTSLQSGGGVLCTFSSATVLNCVITDNRAQLFGGGAYGGTLGSCIVTNNVILTSGRGGGAANSTLQSCLVVSNMAHIGGGTSGSWLYNCAVIRNVARSDGSGCEQSWLDSCTVSLNSTIYAGAGYAVTWAGFQVFARNCIIWNNKDGFNYFGGRLTNCCTYPLPTGTGSIATDPQLLGDGYHLADTSPCINAGNPTFLSGTDIDGQPWADPPAMGCDQWRPELLVVVQPRPKATARAGMVSLTAVTAGAPPTDCFWTKNGLPLANDDHYTNAQSTALLIRNFGVADAGAYQLMTSNTFGVATSQVVQVSVQCVDAASATPTPPYTNWATAAAAIQDAVDVASSSDVVLVTNGIYASGGRTNSGALTNRLVIDQPLLVMSVNGPDNTIIEGHRDPSTTGASAVRCAWLGDGASLSGFTLRNGDTVQNFYGYDTMGGGALCFSTNAELVNCVVTNCRGRFSGGGVQNGVVRNSTLIGNTVTSASGPSSGGGGAAFSILLNTLVMRNASAGRGGGVYSGRLYNCAVTENTAGGAGGGVVAGDLINCTVTGNTSAILGGGVSTAFLTNCIVELNSAPTDPNVAYPLKTAFTCSTPLLAGPGNIAADPQVTDGWHLSPSSPCRGLGSASTATGTDLDGESWANPPSMGCDEVNDAVFIGPLSVGVTAAYPEVAALGSLPLFGEVTGRASRVEWSFGDGPSQTNLSALTFHTWTNPGDYVVTFTAFNADNPAGVSASTPVQVVPLLAPQLSTAGRTNNNFTLRFPGQPGITYVVEQTTNLAAPVFWQTVQALTSTGDLMQVTDSKATNAMRFYRARVQ